MSEEPKVVSLRQERPIDNVSASLRQLADEIDNGKHGDFPVTTCVVLLGHTDSPTNPDEEGWSTHRYHWDTRAYGVRSDLFTVRGLMATCLRGWNSD